MLVYFSGHGTVSNADREKVLLAVKDTDSTHEESFLAAQKVRELLQKSNAKNRLFVIDACHAGGVKSSAPILVRETPLTGVITLASCTQHESSGTWAEKNMSNFSFWLNEAMKGYADLNFDAIIDTAELSSYVSSNLNLKTELQHAVLVKNAETPHFGLFTPRARQVYSVLDDLADQIILYASLKGATELKTSGFLPVSTHGTMRSSDFTPIDYNQLKKTSLFCTEELSRRILLKSQGKLTVTPDSSNEKGALSCQIRREGKYYFLTCKLEFTGEKATPIAISQRILVEAAYETPAVQETPADYVRSRVSLEVKTPYGYQPRALEYVEGQYYVVLNEGEVYRIVIQRFPQPGTPPRKLGAKIFVDGRSIIPQALSPVSASKFQIVGRTDGGHAAENNTPSGSENNPPGVLSTGEEVESPNIPSEAAKFFFLCGQELDSPYNINAKHEFHGFLKTTGEAAKYREFLVKAGSQTDGMEEHIGLITVSFYELADSKAFRGTTEGNWGVTRAPVVDGLTTKAHLQTVTLRYVPENEMQTLRQGKTVKTLNFAE